MELVQEFKELTVEDISRGYTYEKDTGIYRCIFCGREYYKGRIYDEDGIYLEAEMSMALHMKKNHMGVFHQLLKLDKEISGISDLQKTFLKLLHAKNTNKEISEEMGISLSTVRGHRFNIEKLKRQAKIFLAVLNAMDEKSCGEDVSLKGLEEIYSKSPDTDLSDIIGIDDVEDIDFNRNNLHPFFTNLDLE